MGIEPVLLFSKVELKQNVLTIPPRRHISIQNNEKYIDRQSNFVITGKKIMNELQIVENQLYMCTAEVQ